MKKLTPIVSSLQEILVCLQSYEHATEIPAIELDICLQKMRDAYAFLKDVDSQDNTETVAKEQIQVDLQPSEEISMEENEIQDTVIPSKLNMETHFEEKQEIITQEVESKIGNTQNKVSFAPKPANDLGTKLGQKPIADIMSAMGINDKYIFRSQLFKNDETLFKSTIATLNQCENFEQAMEYVSQSFDWDFESPIVNTFMQIIKRRFS